MYGSAWQRLRVYCCNCSGLAPIFGKPEEASKLIADKLRRQADVFTDLTGLQYRVGRDPIEGRTTRLLNFDLISRAELSNGDVEASSASPERSPPVMRVEVGSDISDGEWLCCVTR